MNSQTCVEQPLGERSFYGRYRSVVVIEKACVWRPKLLIVIFGHCTKEALFFQLITHDTDKNKSAYILVRNKKLCCDKTKHYKKLISWEFIVTSRISTLFSGCYIQLTKCLGHHLSGCWSRCTGSHYKERSLT